MLPQVRRLRTSWGGKPVGRGPVQGLRSVVLVLRSSFPTHLCDELGQVGEDCEESNSGTCSRSERAEWVCATRVAVRASASPALRKMDALTESPPRMRASSSAMVRIAEAGEYPSDRGTLQSGYDTWGDGAQAEGVGRADARGSRRVSNRGRGIDEGWVQRGVQRDAEA